jgi:hypothetical protein
MVEKGVGIVDRKIENTVVVRVKKRTGRHGKVDRYDQQNHTKFER